MQEILIIIWAIFSCLIALFLLSIKLRDNSVIDAFWGMWFVIIAVMSYFLFSDKTTAQTVLTLLVTAWWVRLFLNIMAKKLPYTFGHEDTRYARWRKQWKYFYTRSFFQVYMLQGFLMFLVATPILLVNLFQVWEVSSSLIFFWWAVALFWLIYEARADAELAGFIVNKKSWDILISWLRKYHRYPQYFWESVFWLWVSIIASSISAFAFIWFWVIFILVRYVSWVPLLEERYKWQENYEVYSKTTPIFLPDYSKIKLLK